MGRNPIKPQAPKQGRFVRAPEPTGLDAHPHFAFHLTVGGFGVRDLSVDQRADVLEAICTRATMTWGQMYMGGQNKLGCHKVPRNLFREAIPSSVSPDEPLLVFSFGKEMQRVIGVKRQEVFFVVWFDPDGRVYNHGS